MGGGIMVSVVKGMGGGLTGDYSTHDEKAGQDPENECCAG